MRKWLSICGAAAALALLTATAQAQLEVYQATLFGENERPTPRLGLPSIGLAEVIYDPIGNTLDLSLSFFDLAVPASAGHIHFGDINTAGPVIFPFAGLPAATSGTYDKVLTSADFIPRPANGINTFADAIAALRAGNTYVNLHNSVYPGGEIRGQLALVPESGTVALLLAGAVPLAGLVLRRRRR